MFAQTVKRREYNFAHRPMPLWGAHAAEFQNFRESFARIQSRFPPADHQWPRYNAIARRPKLRNPQNTPSPHRPLVSFPDPFAKKIHHVRFLLRACARLPPEIAEP